MTTVKLYAFYGRKTTVKLKQILDAVSWKRNKSNYTNKKQEHTFD